jgi:hypothetical protein
MPLLIIRFFPTILLKPNLFSLFANSQLAFSVALIVSLSLSLNYKININFYISKTC